MPVGMGSPESVPGGTPASAPEGGG
jgi:hypothetical protein